MPPTHLGHKLKRRGLAGVPCFTPMLHSTHSVAPLAGEEHMIYLVRTWIEVMTGLGLPSPSAPASSTGSLLRLGRTAFLK